jgi:hypothetical protein
VRFVITDLMRESPRAAAANYGSVPLLRCRSKRLDVEPIETIDLPAPAILDLAGKGLTDPNDLLRRARRDETPTELP